VLAGLVAGTILGALFIALEFGFIWGLGRTHGSPYLYYPLQALHLLMVGLWLFINGVALFRGGDRPLSVRVTLGLALVLTLAVFPRWRLFGS